MPASPGIIRTAVYVDGYNFYYGRLRGTRYKWLDLCKLFSHILDARDQNETLVMLKMFTAHALANFSTHKAASVAAQDAYHRALKALYDDRYVSIHGRHTYDRNGALLPEFVPGHPYDRRRRVRVWRLEEKQTDVNLALHLFIDAWQGRYDRVILASNDSDVAPVLASIRQHFPDMVLGLVVPVAPAVGVSVPRRVSGSLARTADWILPALTDEQLAQAQLPLLIPTRKKPIHKPAHW